MLKELDKEKIERLAKQMASNDFVDLAYMTRSNNNSETFIHTLLLWASYSGFPVQDSLDGAGDGDAGTIILKHDMGERWSLFLSKSIKHYFDSFNFGRVNFEVPDNLLVIKMRN